MAGWIDDVLDTWVLAQLRTGRAAGLGASSKSSPKRCAGRPRRFVCGPAAGSACEWAGLRAFADD